MRKLTCSMVLGTALLLGCGSASPENSQVSIYGGSQVEEGNWPGTVAVTGILGMYCSGTAVSPWLVITAAHCLEGLNLAGPYVYVGSGRFMGFMVGQHTAKRFGMAKNYNPRGGEWNDIGYIVLSKPLDLPEEAYVPILADEKEIKELLAPGKKARIVGFGWRENWGLGRKYESDAEIMSVSENKIWIGGNGIGACQGDSGGPAYAQLANGEWRVFGVVSRGRRCGEGAISTLMHSHVCWIQEDSGVDLNLPAGYCD